MEKHLPSQCLLVLKLQVDASNRKGSFMAEGGNRPAYFHVEESNRNLPRNILPRNILQARRDKLQDGESETGIIVCRLGLGFCLDTERS